MFVVCVRELGTASLTTFELAWKTTTVLALAIAKYCSDLTLSCIDNQHLIPPHHAAVFIPVSSGMMDQLGHLPP